MTANRVVERQSAIYEIADSVRDRQHWIIATTPQTTERVANGIPEEWEAVVYLDSGTPVILVGTPITVLATYRLMPVLEVLGQSELCALYVIQKSKATVAELNEIYKPFGQGIPEDGSQDILMFAEPLDNDVAVTYTPTLILQVASEVDGRDYTSRP